MAIVPSLSKSTLSGWVRYVKLTPEQEKGLRRNIEKITYSARVKAAWTKRKEKQARIKKIFETAEKEYSPLSKNPLFLIGLVLYWAEGGRKKGNVSI